MVLQRKPRPGLRESGTHTEESHHGYHREVHRTPEQADHQEAQGEARVRTPNVAGRSDPEQKAELAERNRQKARERWANTTEGERRERLAGVKAWQKEQKAAKRAAAKAKDEPKAGTMKAPPEGLSAHWLEFELARPAKPGSDFDSRAYHVLEAAAAGMTG